MIFLTRTLLYGFAAVAALSGLACRLAPGGGGARARMAPVEKTIRWERETLTLVASRGSYGRMARLGDGRIMCAFDRRGEIWTTISADEGRTWPPAKLAARFAHGPATNPELLRLANGWLLLLVNQRPRDGEHPFAIRVHVSKDGGETWRPHALVFAGDTEWKNGCWEPAAIQLPSGEIQLFFANEQPFPETNEQEIALVRSRDNGRTWTPPQRISFRPGCRDGMPSPLVLANGEGVAVAIEDWTKQAKLQPSVIFSSLADNWNQPSAGPDSPRRWRALQTPLDPEVYAGAPCLRQFPSGETVLSSQSDEDGGEPVMAVYLGDANARNFAHKTTPFPVDAGKSGKWNALFIKSATTVTAISGTTINGVKGLWTIDGRLEVK